ncbi:MAG: ferredoxin family protein [Anaerolineales bacterium]|nr:ferredoxin family protein [Anaerolineales bacterium]MCB8954342.1 ferredoxin family protein [Ardenticatenales bacterium]
MTHIVTRLCLRDTACVDVCPVECMVLGKPEAEWPWLYIDPDTCIDCGACVPECPYEAIFPEEDVPFDYKAQPGQWIANTKELLPDGVPLKGEIEGHEVNVMNAKQLAGGEILDLTEDIPANYDFYSMGPGYGALDN